MFKPGWKSRLPKAGRGGYEPPLWNLSHAHPPPELPAGQNSSELYGRGGRNSLRSASEYSAPMDQDRTSHPRSESSYPDTGAGAFGLFEVAARKEQADLPARRNVLLALPGTPQSCRRHGGLSAFNRYPRESFRHLSCVRCHDLPASQSDPVRAGSRQIACHNPAGTLTHKRERPALPKQ